jgi:hypothetical protein
MSEVTDLSARIARLQEQIAQDQAQLSTARQEFRDRLVARLEFGISQKEQQLAEAQGQLAQAQQRDALGTSSAGQVVATEQRGNSEGSTTQNPQTPFVQSNTGLNVLPEEDIEFGTDGRVRPLNETQATPAAPQSNNNLSPTINTSGGAGSPTDDGTPKNTLSVQQTINANFSQRIDPRPNILDQYASYTYSLTWYLLTPDQYNQMSVQSKINLSNWQILVQSGGASISPGNGLPGRNEFFSNDYYLDNFVLKHAVALKGTTGPMNLSNITFTVTEPNGFTFIENLYRAVSTTYKRDNINVTPTAYQVANYCMVIRFYGYNEFGELLQVGKTTNPGGGTPGVTISTDVRAVVEKYIPFTLADLKTRIVSRQIEYQIEAQPNPHGTAFSTQRGTIPYNFELAGSTVGNLLNGRPVGTKYTRTDGRTSTADPPGNNPNEPLNPINGAGVDVNGNFTGTSDSPFTVAGA